MKNIIPFVLILFLFLSCSSSKKATSADKDAKKIEVLHADEAGTYVLQTFDNNFEDWFNIHNASAEDRSLDYFKKWNIRYVNDWNMRSRSLSASKFFSVILEFDPFYYNDLNLQRKLFLYFQYVETVLGQKILFGSSPDFVI